jgi:tRNA-dihydrouridine synthase
MRVCEKSGAEAITVHMRLREERPAEPAHWDEMERLWDAVQAGDQGVATWEEMNRIEMGISWDI